MTSCFALREYSSTSKTKIAIFHLTESALIWWGNLEKQLHLTSNNVPWEVFEESFRAKFLPPYFQEKHVEAFQMLVQGNKTVEEYEMRLMELIKYVPYLDTDERQAEHFVYGLNTRIRAMVRMWKPSLVTNAVECARYAEEHLGIKRDVRPIGPPQPGFPGKTPSNFLKGSSSRPPPYGNRFTPRRVGTRAPMEPNVICAESSKI